MRGFHGKSPGGEPLCKGFSAPAPEDIFWDDFEHQLVGTAAIGVTPLLKLDLVREYITLRDFAGEVSGAVEASRRAENAGIPAESEGFRAFSMHFACDFGWFSAR